MSDLAPFVAAAIRDRNVVELMEENQRKEEMIDEFFKVEITGPNGAPVYAQGHFYKDGATRYGPRVSQWFPSLRHRQDCSLAELSGVEVRLGGAVQFTLDPFRDQQVCIYLDFRDAHHDYNGGKDMLIQPDDGAELCVVIYGWPENNWRPLLQQEDAWDESAEAAFDYFDGMVNPSSRDCSVRFECLAFNVTKYEAMIRRVALSEKETRQRQEQLQYHAFQMALVERMEAAGILNGSIQTEIALLVTYELKILTMNDEFEQVFGPIANLYTNRGDDRHPYETYRELRSFIDNTKINDKDTNNRRQALADFVARLEELIRREGNDDE